MLTGISGSYTSAIAAMMASSVGLGGVSPSGVQAVWLTSFTARLLASIECGDQSVPGEGRALHPRGVLVHARERLQPFQRFRQPRVACRANAGTRHVAERLEHRAGIRLAAADHRLRHEIS